MNFVPLIAPLITAIAAMVISSIRDPGGWRFEKQTKRLQYWKAMLEVVKLAEAESAIKIDFKSLCHQDLIEIVNDDAERRSRFAKELATTLTFYLLFAVVILALRLSQSIQGREFGFSTMSVEQFRAFKAMADYMLEVLEFGCLLVLWIWIRPHIRRYMWTKFMKPGNEFGSLFENKRVQGVSSLTLIFLLPLLTSWLLAQIV